MAWITPKYKLSVFKATTEMKSLLAQRYFKEMQKGILAQYDPHTFLFRLSADCRDILMDQVVVGAEQLSYRFSIHAISTHTDITARNM